MSSNTEADAITHLIGMIDRNNNHTDDRYVFVNADGVPNKKAYEIGVKLHEVGGTISMHTIMTQLQIIVNAKIDQGYDWVENDLRQLEFCWNGIGEWMA